jgi:O-antigen/teichoic acid export membrane protein
LPTVPGVLAAWVVASSDRYVIGYFLGAASVGIYSTGYLIGNIPVMLIGILGFVLPPTLSKLYDEGRMNEVKTHLSYSLKYLLMMTIPFVFGATVLSKQVLTLFSTIEIASQGYYVVSLVALATLLVCICVPFGEILIVVKKTKIVGIAYTLAALINLGLNLLIVPICGILGAVISTLIAYSVLVAIEVHYSLREFRFDIDWRFIIKSLIASAIMALVIWLMHPQSNLNIIITVLVGVAVYGAGLFLLKGLKREEISFFRELLKRRGPTANADDKAE